MDKDLVPFYLPRRWFSGRMPAWARAALLLLGCEGPFLYSADQASSGEPRIPKMFDPALGEKCRQAVLVLSTEERSVPARLWLMERMVADKPWRTAAGPIAVTLGRSGLAWGDGEHTGPAPAGFRTKREGDGCSPAGVFRIPYAFGYAPKAEADMLRLPYLPVSNTLFGVDDSESRFYNQVVDTAKVAKDWNSAEIMLREDGLYRWGAFVAHNPRSRPRGGSCIFLHLWKGPGEPTSGCTAMAQNDLKRLLTWLDPTQEPRLVQALESW